MFSYLYNYLLRGILIYGCDLASATIWSLSGLPLRHGSIVTNRANSTSP